MQVFFITQLTASRRHDVLKDLSCDRFGFNTKISNNVSEVGNPIDATPNTVTRVSV
ncbi:hypothetical protein [Dyadobacter psychrotolerans]|uniref:hypothetical protein n=1 Tax=Dyadobacter psychrotolerans TaxID=2541721 RepID=UPI001404D20D|nr:hypothetical protein [Dyadobacter psychrotolerans]